MALGIFPVWPPALEFRHSLTDDDANVSTFKRISEDLIVNIFSRLEEDPRHLARLACVCERFSSVVRNVCWKRHCVRNVPELLASAKAHLDSMAAPPGGWGGLMKLLVCCPGLQHAGVLLDCWDFGLDRELGSSDQYDCLPRPGRKSKRRFARCLGQASDEANAHRGDLMISSKAHTGDTMICSNDETKRCKASVQQEVKAETVGADSQRIPSSTTYSSSKNAWTGDGKRQSIVEPHADVLRQVDARVVDSEKNPAESSSSPIQLSSQIDVGKEKIGKRKERLEKGEDLTPSKKILSSSMLTSDATGTGKTMRLSDLNLKLSEGIGKYCDGEVTERSQKASAPEVYIVPLVTHCDRLAVKETTTSTRMSSSSVSCHTEHVPAPGIAKTGPDSDACRLHLASGAWNLSREQGNKLLASRFRSDSLYICDWPGCVHPGEKRQYKLFRGIFKNFKSSHVWRNLRDMKCRPIGMHCAFCTSASSWDMMTGFCLRRSFEYHDDGEPVVRAFVCDNGHVSGAWTDRPLYTT